MEIESFITNHRGESLKVLYRDIDSSAELEGRKVSAVHAYCFFEDKLVIVYSPAKGYWTAAGGGVEMGETPEEAVIREVKEETNMKVLKSSLLGYQDIFETKGITTQMRSVCIVEPYDDFHSDPDGDIAQIKLIEPSEYKNYFDWGSIGDHLMERALERKAILEQ